MSERPLTNPGQPRRVRTLTVAGLQELLGAMDPMRRIAILGAADTAWELTDLQMDDRGMWLLLVPGNEICTEVDDG